MEDIYKVILEDTLSGYWDWNIPEGTEYLSPTFKSMFGYEDHELENSPETWQRLIFPDDLTVVLKNYKEHVESQGEIPYKNEVRYRHKDGSTVWVLCTGRVIEWDGKDPIRMVGCHIDITRQKEVEKKLKSTQELLNKTNEAALVGGWEVDLIQGRVAWTDVTKTIHEVDKNFEPDLESGINFYREGESREKITAAVEKAIATGESFDLELQITTAKNNLIWIRTIGQAEFEKGKCVRLYGAFQDISRRKKAEEQLKISEVKFEDAFNYSAIGMALVSLEGKWMKVNKRLCDLVGYTEEELLKITFQDITHPDDLDIDLENIQNLLSDKIDSYSMEKRYFTKSGETVWVLLSVSLVRNVDGTPQHFISQIEDVTKRKKAEQDLQKAHGELTSIFSAINYVSVIATDLDGTIKHFSNGSEALLGYTKEEMIDVHSPAIIHLENEVVARGKELSKKHGEEIAGFDVFIHYAKQDRYESREWTYVRKDGTTFPVQLVVSAVKNNDGEIVGYLGIATDISEVKNVYHALQESEKKFRKIFENVQDVFYQADYDGKIIEISPSIEKYSGFSREEIIGKNVTEFYYYAEDRDKLLEALKESGNVNDFEVRLKTSSDELIYVSVNAHLLFDEHMNIKGVEGSMRDITERKEAESLLKDSHELLSKMSEQLPGAIYQYQYFPDTGKSSFPFASIGLREVYEVMPEYVKDDASKVFERIHKDDLENVTKTIEHSAETLEDWNHEYRVSLPMKGIRWVKGAARPEKQPDDSIIWHGYIADVTEAKEKEEELNNTVTIVGEQNKRLFNFAHIVSHNLRSHSGNFELLLSLIAEAKDESEKNTLFDHLNTVSKQLNETIVHLNEVVSIQTNINLQQKSLDLHQYVENTLGILAGDIKKKNAIITNKIPEGTTIKYNEAYMESILLNFLSNALKYKHPDRDPEVLINYNNIEGSPIIEVKDNGIGIDLNKYGKKLFGMYKTFHGNEDAKGIGLFITKNQIEALGGKIEVESKVGEGTTFKIYLK